MSFAAAESGKSGHLVYSIMLLPICAVMAVGSDDTLSHLLKEAVKIMKRTLFPGRVVLALLQDEWTRLVQR